MSTTHILFFSNVTLFYVTVPNFFPIYCYFMSTISPPTTGAVKTLPLHTPISLVLSFSFPMNSQFNFFLLIEFLFQFQQHNLICMPYSSFCLSFQFVYFQQTPPPYQEPVLTHHKHHRLFRSWHNATTKFDCHNIHNSFGNSVIQSVHQPSIYSRLN